MGRDAERGGCGTDPCCGAGLCAATARARPLLWLRLTPHRMSHRRVLLSTAMSSLSLCLPMGSKLSLTEPCATPNRSEHESWIAVMLTSYQEAHHGTKGVPLSFTMIGLCSSMPCKELKADSGLLLIGGIQTD